MFDFAGKRTQFESILNIFIVSKVMKVVLGTHLKVWWFTYSRLPT